MFVSCFSGVGERRESGKVKKEEAPKAGGPKLRKVTAQKWRHEGWLPKGGLHKAGSRKLWTPKCGASSPEHVALFVLSHSKFHCVAPFLRSYRGIVVVFFGRLHNARASNRARVEFSCPSFVRKPKRAFFYCSGASKTPPKNQRTDFLRGRKEWNFGREQENQRGILRDPAEECWAEGQTEGRSDGRAVPRRACPAEWRPRAGAVQEKKKRKLRKKEVSTCGTIQNREKTRKNRMQQKQKKNKNIEELLVLQRRTRLREGPTGLTRRAPMSVVPNSELCLGISRNARRRTHHRGVGRSPRLPRTVGVCGGPFQATGNPRDGTTRLVQEVVHSAVLLCGAGIRDVAAGTPTGFGRQRRGTCTANVVWENHNCT